MEETLTYVALGADGRSSFLDLRISRPDEDATLYAHDLLREHASCSSVEIWSESECLAVVAREAEGHLQLASSRD
jgi:hypothetical protein